jgi:hypothetical protein
MLSDIDSYSRCSIEQNKSSMVDELILPRSKVLVLMILRNCVLSLCCKFFVARLVLVLCFTTLECF